MIWDFIIGLKMMK